jgi:hypothetical protein
MCRSTSISDGVASVPGLEVGDVFRKHGAEFLERRGHTLSTAQRLVGYFHVVFTLPTAIAEIALQNQAVLYDMLFRTSAETMQESA